MAQYHETAKTGTRSLTLGRQCFYNKSYGTLKIEGHGVVVTLEDLA